jgi:FkbM family methyltransferase
MGQKAKVQNDFERTLGEPNNRGDPRPIFISGRGAILVNIFYSIIMNSNLRLLLFYRLLNWLQIRHIGGHWLYIPIITSESQVVDGGANLGKFSSAIVTRFGCPCLAIEPVTDYYMKIENLKGLRKLNAALSGNDGKQSFWISEQLESSSLYEPLQTKTENRKVEVESFTWSRLLNDLGLSKVDLLKLDIEGAEIELLQNMTDKQLTAIPQIIVEFHDFLYPEHVPAIRNIVSRLQSLGFIELAGTRNYLMDLIFLNKNLIQFPPGWSFLYRIYSLIRFKNNNLYNQGDLN